jgi:hypothetical protein
MQFVCKKAGLAANHYSTYSLRRGMATQWILRAYKKNNNLTLGDAWTTLADHVGWVHNSNAQQRYVDEVTKTAINCSARLNEDVQENPQATLQMAEVFIRDDARIPKKTKKLPKASKDGNKRRKKTIFLTEGLRTAIQDDNQQTNVTTRTAQKNYIRHESMKMPTTKERIQSDETLKQLQASLPKEQGKERTRILQQIRRHEEYLQRDELNEHWKQTSHTLNENLQMEEPLSKFVDALEPGNVHLCQTNVQ